MSYSDIALLPIGFHDILPEHAAFAEQIRYQLMNTFAQYGYMLVTPPLLEFESSLLAGPGVALAAQTFRVMDSLSHQMMGVRADMTGQVARIARTRLQNSPLPLRLSYAGQVIRIQSESKYAARQLTQAGIELIGTNHVLADVEVIIAAIDGLERLGISALTLDVNVPGLLDIMLRVMPYVAETKPLLREAIIRKEAGQILRLGDKYGPLLLQLATPNTTLEDVYRTVAALHAAISLPNMVFLLLQRLETLLAQLRALKPHLAITLDILEYQGFEYHTTMGFSIFSADKGIELGKGGRYLIPEEAHTTPYEGVGCTLYTHHLLHMLTLPVQTKRIFIPLPTSLSESAVLREAGFATLHAVCDIMDAQIEAKRLGCQYIYEKGVVQPLA